MNKIAKKVVLTETQETRIVQLDITEPHIAKKARAGQFVVLMADEKGERVPLTVVATDQTAGTVRVILQVVGFTTELLAKMGEGDTLYAMVGPLGHATEIRNYGRVILIGGGVGIAEVYPVARALKAVGNHVTTIIGARTKGLLILRKELGEASDELQVTTDDGSDGRKAFTTDILAETLGRGDCGLVYSVGPIPMMRKTADVTRPQGVKTLVSLNALMLDATGMCGCCRVTVGGEVKFSCVDGPEFDAHDVDWDELTKRNSVYTEQEKHICKLSRHT